MMSTFHLEVGGRFGCPHFISSGAGVGAVVLYRHRRDTQGHLARLTGTRQMKKYLYHGHQTPRTASHVHIYISNIK